MDIKFVTLTTIFCGAITPLALAYGSLLLTKQKFKKATEDDAMDLAKLAIRRASISSRDIG